MVAVKVFLANLDNKIETLSCAELLEEACKDDQKQSAYKEIRQEVSVYLYLQYTLPLSLPSLSLPPSPPPSPSSSRLPFYRH